MVSCIFRPALCCCSLCTWYLITVSVIFVYWTFACHCHNLPNSWMLIFPSQDKKMSVLALHTLWAPYYTVVTEQERMRKLRMWVARCGMVVCCDSKIPYSDPRQDPNSHHLFFSFSSRSQEIKRLQTINCFVYDCNKSSSFTKNHKKRKNKELKIGISKVSLIN